MRKVTLTLGILALIGLFLAPAVFAQWGAIQSGADALKRAKEAEKQPQPQQQQQPAQAAEGKYSMSDKTGTSGAPVTYQNKVAWSGATLPGMRNRPTSSS